MKRTVCIMAAAMSVFATGCQGRTIDPVSDDMTLEQAASDLGCEADRLQLYFDSIDMTFDEFKAQLKSSGTSVTDFKSRIESQCPEGSTFADYVEFNIFDADDSLACDVGSEYTKIDTPNSVYDIYFRTEDLKGMTFKDFPGSEIITSSDSDYNQIWLAFDSYGNNPSILAPAVDGIFGEEGYLIGTELLPNVILSGDSGKVVGDEQKNNPIFTDGYFWKVKDDKLYETEAASVVAVRYYADSGLEHTDKDVFILASRTFGFIIKTEGREGYHELCEISRFPMVVRYNREREKELKEGRSGESETQAATEAASENTENA